MPERLGFEKTQAYHTLDEDERRIECVEYEIVKAAVGKRDE